MIKFRVHTPQTEFEKKCERLLAGEYDQDTLVNEFVSKLTEDISNMQKGLNVSDCALSAPRRGGHADKKTNIAKEIALRLHPHGDEKKERTWSYVEYTQTISKLTSLFTEQLEEAERKEKEWKSAYLTNRENYEEMKNRPSTEAVTQPSAMPVDVAPLDELQPFLNHMMENVPVVNNEEGYVEFVRGAHYDDQRIDLCKQVVGPNWIQPLMDSIVNNNHVKHFLLGNNIINYQGAQAIASFIENPHVPKIETWYIAGNSIDAAGVRLITKALENDTDAKSLWLKRNPLNVEGVSYVANMLKKNSSIECLDLHNTNCGDEGIKLLFDALKENTCLKRIYLGANGIGVKSADYVAGYFNWCVQNDHVGLDSLWFDMNRFGDDGVCKIAASLQNYKHLKRITLGSNRITKVGAKALFDALNDHEDLIMIDIGAYKATSDMGELPNNLKDDGAHVVADFIRTNNHVKILNISQNAITESGMQVIVDAFEENTSLLYIYYDQYGSQLTRSTKDRLHKCMSKNIKSNLGIEFEEFHKGKLRFMKHTKDILKIDSIYRNRM